MKGNNWPEPRVARLLELFASGLTMNAMADALNAAEPGLDTTGSAVSGMCNRLRKKYPEAMTRPVAESGWTEERVTLLRTMWEQGQSAGQITEVIGFTRSAVLGKLKRLYKAGKPIRAVSAKTPRQTRPTGGKGRFVLPRQKYNGGRHAHLSAVIENSAAKLTPRHGYTARAGAFEPLSGTNPRTLTERPFNGCCWPVGGEGADTLFCCAPKAGRSYCAAHESAGISLSAPSPAVNEKHWIVTPRRRAA